MTNNNESGNTQARDKGKSRSGFKTFLIVLAAVFIGIVAAAFAIRYFMFPSALKPVSLNASEQMEVNQKARVLGFQGKVFENPSNNAERKSAEAMTEEGRLKPEAYSEEGAEREVRFSERELNGIIASSPEWAQRLAIDLGDSLASAKLLLPLDPDFPVMGGRTVKINAGVEMQFVDGKPSIKLRGVSLWGVPVPNAWLGNLKNVDLVEQFGGDAGFWQSFAAGIEMIDIRDGELYLKLQE